MRLPGAAASATVPAWRSSETAQTGGGPSDSGGHPIGFIMAASEPPGGLRVFGQCAWTRGGAEPEGRAMTHLSYQTKGGVRVEREVASRPYSPADTALADALDRRRGVLFSSSFEFPGRYTRWDMGFVDPPLMVTARGRDFAVEALNARGRVLVAPVAAALAGLADVRIAATGAERIAGAIADPEGRF